jgi:hypothetical protein
MKNLESKKEVGIAVPTSSKLLVLMTDQEIEKNRVYLDNFQLFLDSEMSLLTTHMPQHPRYDRFKIHIYHGKNNRLMFRVLEFKGVRKWELYPSVIASIINKKEDDSILFVYATRNSAIPHINREHGAILCDHEAFLSLAILAEFNSQYDIDTFIEYCPSSYYKKRLRWSLDTYLKRAFPFNVRLPRWLSE